MYYKTYYKRYLHRRDPSSAHADHTRHTPRRPRWSRSASQRWVWHGANVPAPATFAARAGEDLGSLRASLGFSVPICAKRRLDLVLSSLAAASGPDPGLAASWAWLSRARTDQRQLGQAEPPGQGRAGELPLNVEAEGGSWVGALMRRRGQLEPLLQLPLGFI